MKLQLSFLSATSPARVEKLKSIIAYTLPQDEKETEHKGFKSGYMIINRSGAILEEFYYEETGKIITKMEYMNGKLAKEINIKPSGDMDSQVIIEYDEADRAKKKLFHLSNGDILYSINIYYDHNGRIEREEIIDNARKLLRTDKHSYDDHNNLTGIEMVPIGEKLFYYNKSNALIREVENTAGKSTLDMSTNYYYDPLGLLRLAKTYDGALTVFEYSWYE